MASATTTTTSPNTSTSQPQPPQSTLNPTDPTPHLTALLRDGYVLIPSLLPPHLLLALQATSKYLTSKARTGTWPHIRSVPKQYPPWPPNTPGTNIWGIQHLLHPDMPVRDVYAELYFADTILDVVKELVGLPVSPASDDHLVMELFNLLVSPAHTDFQLAWHRDDIKPDVSPAEEARLLHDKAPHGRQLHAQYNVALFDDDSLIVIPGSHARVRSDVERGAGPHDPLPGEVRVELKPGDAVFYNSNILHRGAYRGIDPGTELGRMTLHGSVGLSGHGSERARQVLQHGVGEWVGGAEFTALEGRKKGVAEGMRARLMGMGSGEGLGFSLEG